MKKLKFKNMKKISLFIILVFNCMFVWSQETEIRLTKEVGSGPFLYLSRPAYLSKETLLNTPDTLRLKEFLFYTFDLYPIGELYRDFKTKKISLQDFQDELKYFTDKPIDTLKLNNFISNRYSRISCFSAIGFNNKHYIGLDINYNGKIDTGELLIYDKQLVLALEKNMLENIDKLPNVVLKEKDGIESINVKIIPLPYFNSYENKTEKELSFYIHLNEYWKSNQNQLPIFAQLRTISTNEQDFVIKDSEHLPKISAKLSKGESYYSTHHQLYFKDYKLNHQVLTLKLMFKKEQSDELKRYFNHQLLNVKTKNKVHLQKYVPNDKYVLFDFWGTWCVPCMANLPNLKKIHHKYKNVLTIVGMAYDKTATEVENTLRKEHITWDNYLIEKNADLNILNQMNVTVFPTYKLFNKKGELIKTWTGKINTKELKEYLK